MAAIVKRFCALAGLNEGLVSESLEPKSLRRRSFVHSKYAEILIGVFGKASKQNKHSRQIHQR
jgi:hypothetical protein